MPATRSWAIVGAIAAVSGLGVGSVAVAGAVPTINLNDPSAVQPDADTNGPFDPATAFDDSPESPDSPNESPSDSAGSASDSPAPVQKVRKAPVADSANSPARGGGSANSGGSAGSAGSAD